MSDRILRRPGVREKTGLSDTQIDREEEQGDFPRRKKITARIVGWSEKEINDWVENRLHGASSNKGSQSYFIDKSFINAAANHLTKLLKLRGISDKDCDAMVGAVKETLNSAGDLSKQGKMA